MSGEPPDRQSKYPVKVWLTCVRCGHKHMVRGRTIEGCRRSIARSGWEVDDEYWHEKSEYSVIATCRECVGDLEEEA